CPATGLFFGHGNPLRWVCHRRKSLTTGDGVAPYETGPRITSGALRGVAGLDHGAVTACPAVGGGAEVVLRLFRRVPRRALAQFPCRRNPLDPADCTRTSWTVTAPPGC